MLPRLSEFVSVIVTVNVFMTLVTDPPQGPCIHRGMCAVLNAFSPLTERRLTGAREQGASDHSAMAGLKDVHKPGHGKESVDRIRWLHSQPVSTLHEQRKGPAGACRVTDSPQTLGPASLVCCCRPHARGRRNNNAGKAHLGEGSRYNNMLTGNRPGHQWRGSPLVGWMDCNLAPSHAIGPRTAGWQPEGSTCGNSHRYIGAGNPCSKSGECRPNVFPSIPVPAAGVMSGMKGGQKWQWTLGSEPIRTSPLHTLAHRSTLPATPGGKVGSHIMTNSDEEHFHDATDDNEDHPEISVRIGGLEPGSPGGSDLEASSDDDVYGLHGIVSRVASAARQNMELLRKKKKKTRAKGEVQAGEAARPPAETSAREEPARHGAEVPGARQDGAAAPGGGPPPRYQEFEGPAGGQAGPLAPGDGAVALQHQGGAGGLQVDHAKVAEANRELPMLLAVEARAGDLQGDHSRVAEAIRYVQLHPSEIPILQAAIARVAAAQAGPSAPPADPVDLEPEPLKGEVTLVQAKPRVRQPGVAMEPIGTARDEGARKREVDSSKPWPKPKARSHSGDLARRPPPLVLDGEWDPFEAIMNGNRDLENKLNKERFQHQETQNALEQMKQQLSSFEEERRLTEGELKNQYKVQVDDFQEEQYQQSRRRLHEEARHNQELLNIRGQHGQDMEEKQNECDAINRSKNALDMDIRLLNQLVADQRTKLEEVVSEHAKGAEGRRRGEGHRDHRDRRGEDRRDHRDRSAPRTRGGDGGPGGAGGAQPGGRPGGPGEGHGGAPGDGPGGAGGGPPGGRRGGAGGGPPDPGADGSGGDRREGRPRGARRPPGPPDGDGDGDGDDPDHGDGYHSDSRSFSSSFIANPNNPEEGIELAYMSLKRATKYGEDGTADSAYIHRLTVKASEILADIEVKSLRVLTGAQLDRIDMCMEMIQKLSKYDSKGVNNDIRRIPIWDGDNQSLSRHLARVDELTRHMKNDALRLVGLEQSLPKYKRYAVAQSGSYEKARATLQLMAHGTQSIATKQMALMLGLTPPRTPEEQDHNLLLAVQYLGIALEAMPRFALYQMESIRLFQIFTSESRPLHLAALNAMIDAQAAKQEDDQPNMAPEIFQYLTKARNASALERSALQMDARTSNATVQASRAQLEHVPKAKGGRDRAGQDKAGKGKDDGRKGGGGGGRSPYGPPDHPICPTCKTGDHNPRCMWMCAGLITIAMSGGTLPTGPCKCCLSNPPTDRCRSKQCHSFNGVAREFLCSQCRCHKNIGSCGTCKKAMVQTKEKLSLRAGKNFEKVSRPQTDQRAAHLMVETSARPAVFNGAAVGTTLTASEVVTAENEEGELFDVSILYDTQAETSMFSPSLTDRCNPRQHADRLTVTGVGAKIHHSFTTKGTLKLHGQNGARFDLEGMILDHPPARPKPIFLPLKWFKQKKRNMFARQIADNPTPYHILLGAELPWHPLPVIGKDGKPEVVGQLRLFRSQLTGKLLCTGIPPKSYYPSLHDTEQGENDEVEIRQKKTDPLMGACRVAFKEPISEECESSTDEDSMPGLECSKCSLDSSSKARRWHEDCPHISRRPRTSPPGTARVMRPGGQPSSGTHTPSDMIGSQSPVSGFGAREIRNSLPRNLNTGQGKSVLKQEDPPSDEEERCEHEACISVRVAMHERTRGRATWNLGEALGDDDKDGEESIEIARHRAKEMMNYFREEVSRLEPVASNCSSCCPRITEMVSNELNFARQLAKSLELVDDTGKAQPDDKSVPTMQEILADPPWNYKDGHPKAKYPKLNKGRKKYRIRLARLMKLPANLLHNFLPESQAATRRIIKQLGGKPKTVQELGFKILQEMESGILFTLEDFIKRPDAIAAGITLENVSAYAMYAGLLLVINDHSMSTPARLVYNPAQTQKGGTETVNSNVGFSGSLIAPLRPTYMRMALAPHWACGDLSGFYLQTILSTEGALMNCIWLQRGADGKPCLTGDKDLELIPCVKERPMFGAVDAGCHAQLALMSTPDLYKTDGPDGADKIPDNLVDFVAKDIKKAWVDDMALVITLHDIQEAMKDLPPAKSAKEYKKQFEETGAMLMEKKGYLTASLVDYFGYAFKEFSVPANKILESRMNQNPLLIIAQPKELRCASRPTPQEVVMESNQKKKLATPRPKSDNSPYLGIAIDNYDRISLKERDLNVSKKRSGVISNPDKCFRTEEQLSDWFKFNNFIMRESLAFIQQDYNPVGNLNGMARFVGKSAFKLVHKAMTEPGEDHKKKWNHEVPKELKPIWLKYFRLYEMTTKKKIDRYALVRCPLDEIKVGIATLTDGGDCSGGELCYLKSWSTKTLETKLILFASNSKQVPLQGRSIPHMELDAAERGADLNLEVLHALDDMGIKGDHIDFVLQMVDSQSTIWMVRQHAGNLAVGFRRQVAKIQVAYIAMENLLGKPGFPNVYDDLVWLDQKAEVGPDNIATTNYADYLTKLDLWGETAEVWMERWNEIHDGGWLNLDKDQWTHLHRGSGGHPADDNRLALRPAQVTPSTTDSGYSTPSRVDFPGARDIWGEMVQHEESLTKDYQLLNYLVSEMHKLKIQSAGHKDAEQNVHLHKLEMDRKYRNNDPEWKSWSFDPERVTSTDEDRQAFDNAKVNQGLEPHAWCKDPKVDIVRPDDDSYDKWYEYYDQLDGNRLAALAKTEKAHYGSDSFVFPGIHMEAYYNPHFYSTTVFRMLGRDAADEFLRMEDEGKDDFWDPAIIHQRYKQPHSMTAAVATNIRAAQLRGENPETVADQRFFSNILGLGAINPERLRSANVGDVHYGQLPKICRITGLVKCLIKKWRARTMAPPKPGTPRYQPKEKPLTRPWPKTSRPDPCYTAPELLKYFKKLDAKWDAMEEAKNEDPTRSKKEEDESTGDSADFDEKFERLTDDYNALKPFEDMLKPHGSETWEKIHSEVQNIGTEVSELTDKAKGRAKDEETEDKENNDPIDPEDAGPPGLLPPGVVGDGSDSDEVYGEVNNDLTSPSRRKDMERIGQWTLAKENMGSLDGIAEDSKHRLISNLLKKHINFEGKKLPVLVGREMKEFKEDTTIEPSDGSSPFLLRVLGQDTPLAKHLTHSVHNEMGCKLAKETYLDALLRRGYIWKGARGTFQRFSDACPSCTLLKAAMRNHACKVSAPGPDYNVKEILSQNPLSTVVIDETGTISMENGEKACVLMCNELMSGRTILIPMASTKTPDLLDTLERLQAIRGGMDTVVLDPLPSHQVIANTSSVTTHGLFLRKKFNTKSIMNKLQRMGITIKLVGSAAHHQAGRAENTSKQFKTFGFNVLHGMKIKHGIHLQSICDKMMACMNNRVKFIDTEGNIHTPNSLMEAAARISTSELKDMNGLINTKSDKIISGVNAVADETRRIITIWAHQSMTNLLAWQVSKFGDQPAIYAGDVVVVLDKITMHHYRSTRRSIGRVILASNSGLSFRIKMCSKGKGDYRPDSVKHRKHLLLLARGADNINKVINLDPFADDGVQQLLTHLHKDLRSHFFENAMEKLPDISAIREELQQFDDPDNMWTLAQINDPATAYDLLHPKGEIIPDLIVKEGKNAKPAKIPKPQDSVRSPMEEPEEVKPVVRTRHGRAVNRPPRFSE